MKWVASLGKTGNLEGKKENYCVSQNFVYVSPIKGGGRHRKIPPSDFINLILKKRLTKNKIIIILLWSRSLPSERNCTLEFSSSLSPCKHFSFFLFSFFFQPFQCSKKCPFSLLFFWNQQYKQTLLLTFKPLWMTNHRQTRTPLQTD